MRAHEICEKAAGLVAGDRNEQHGDKETNFRATADLWNTFLGSRLSTPIEPHEVALMMVLLKVSRVMAGKHNPDNYVDMAGYAGCGGELAILPRSGSPNG